MQAVGSLHIPWFRYLWCPYCGKMVTPVRYRVRKGRLETWQPQFNRHWCLRKLWFKSSLELTRCFTKHEEEEE